MQYVKKSALLLLVLVGCASTRESDWVATDYGDVTARSRQTEIGIVSELRSNVTGELVSSMIVTPDGASWQDANGAVRNLVVGVPEDLPAGAPQPDAVQELPSNELAANDWLYALSLQDGGSGQNLQDPCFDVGTCAFCCAGDVCCYACGNGAGGCFRQVAA